MTALRGQRYESADVKDVGWFCVDPLWCLEQKVDGVRALVSVDDAGRCRFTGVTGEPLRSGTRHFAAIARQLSGLRSLVLDGELLATGQYVVFDILQAAESDVRSMPLSQRRAFLDVIAPAFGGPVTLIPQATTPSAKSALWERIVAEGAEGAVAKRLDGVYATGRARTRTVLKLKVTRTVDCIVVGVGRDGHNNAVLGVYDAGVLTPIGACSLNGKAAVEIGSVIEVEYLNAGTGATPTLYQPRMTRLRPDKAAAECDIDQLAGCPVSRTVLV